MRIGSYCIRLKRSYADLFIPLLFAAVLIYYMYGSWSIMNTDAMLLVRGVGILMALSLIFVIKEEFVIQKVDDSPPEVKTPFFAAKDELKNFIGFTFLVALYLVALPYLGFIISTAVYSLTTMLFLGVKSPKVLILLPILLTASAYIMFRIFLLVPLPVGVFGI